jgi:hypothetical protein
MAVSDRRIRRGAALVILIFLLTDLGFGLPCCDELPELPAAGVRMLCAAAAPAIEVGETCVCCAPVPVAVSLDLEPLHALRFESVAPRFGLPFTSPASPFHPQRS